ncbi:MAG: hypothetical protein H7315_10450 [Herminiimonas sp.]|nr:hypothetical protein [Herminiimonas sp.]
MRPILLRPTLAATDVARTSVRRISVALVVGVGSLAVVSAGAAGHTSDASARFQAESAVCNNGQSNQDRATCLKEAGAALDESKKGRLDEGKGSFKQNAMTRCEALPSEERDACQRRIDGEGTTSGSVGSGGLLREVVTPVKN